MPSSPEDTNGKKDQQLQDLRRKESDNDVTSSPTKRLRGGTSQALEWEEIEINIGWGVLRGKARGTGQRLILGLHGWLDNANTFDLIAPLLPKNVRFLSLDLPGHGLSDHFPAGFIYDPRGYVGAVKKAMTVIGWKQFVLLGHSMGAVVGILYTSIFEEDVEAFISIDIIKPWSHPPEKYASQLKKYFLQYFDNENKTAKPALTYEHEELVKKTIEGSKSLDDKGARILLERGAKKDENGKGFILTRDLRAKAYFIGFISFEAWLELAKSIKCPLLFIKAKEALQSETLEGSEAMLMAFRQDCKHFCYREISSNHHIHHTHANTVGVIIQHFLDECKATEGHHYETFERYEAMLTAFKQDCKHYCYQEMSGKHHIHLTHANTVGVYIERFLEECKIEYQNCTINIEV